MNERQMTCAQALDRLIEPHRKGGGTSNGSKPSNFGESMNRKQRRAWYREKGMSYGEARKVACEQARLEAQVLRMSPEGARRVLAEWARQQHSQGDVDAMNGRTADAGQHQADV